MRKKLILGALLAGLVGLAIMTSGPAGTVEPNPWGPGATSPFDTTPQGIRPAPDCHTFSPACPTSLGSANLTAALDLPTFTVSPTTGTPTVPATDAMNIAWQEGGGGGDSQKALLGVLLAGGSNTCNEQPVACGGAVTSDALVWVVQYYNGCTHPSGMLSQADEDKPLICGTTTSVLIDATTGDFISAFEVSPGA